MQSKQEELAKEEEDDMKQQQRMKIMKDLTKNQVKRKNGLWKQMVGF